MEKHLKHTAHNSLGPYSPWPRRKISKGVVASTTNVQIDMPRRKMVGDAKTRSLTSKRPHL